jgi:hypothetical protein
MPNALFITLGEFPKGNKKFKKIKSFKKDKLLKKD